MTIQSFASKCRLRTSIDVLGETICAARKGGSHIYEHSVMRMGVVFCPDPHSKKPPTVRQWNKCRDEMKAAGFVIQLDCYGEGVGLFDPTNESQVKIALKVARIRPKRLLSPEHLAVLAKSSEGHRFKTGAPVGLKRVGQHCAKESAHSETVFALVAAATA